MRQELKLFATYVLGALMFGGVIAGLLCILSGLFEVDLTVYVRPLCPNDMSDSLVRDQVVMTALAFSAIGGFAGALGYLISGSTVFTIVGRLVFGVILGAFLGALGAFLVDLAFYGARLGDMSPSRKHASVVIQAVGVLVLGLEAVFDWQYFTQRKAPLWDCSEMATTSSHKLGIHAALVILLRAITVLYLASLVLATVLVVVGRILLGLLH
jgi:hypothetical protein